MTTCHLLNHQYKKNGFRVGQCRSNGVNRRVREIDPLFFQCLRSNNHKLYF